MNSRKSRILCVDDEALNLSLLEAILLPRGFEVVTAVNGPEALFSHCMCADCEKKVYGELDKFREMNKKL